MTSGEFVQVAVEAPLSQTLTYRVPPDLAQVAGPGARVKVPLGGRYCRGVVLADDPKELSADIEIKNIADISKEPFLGERTLKWLKWLAQYYLHPPGQVYSLAFAPAGEKRKRPSKKKIPNLLRK